MIMVYHYFRQVATIHNAGVGKNFQPLIKVSGAHKFINSSTLSTSLCSSQPKYRVKDEASDLHTQETRVEAGSNTSTVTLRVVRGDEMGLKKAAP
jgi:hypothetical protein